MVNINIVLLLYFLLLFNRLINTIMYSWKSSCGIRCAVEYGHKFRHEVSHEVNIPCRLCFVVEAFCHMQLICMMRNLCERQTRCCFLSVEQKRLPQTNRKSIQQSNRYGYNISQYYKLYLRTNYSYVVIKSEQFN